MVKYSAFLASLLVAGRALAVPIPEEKRAVTTDLLSTFQLMEQYSAAAYCPNNNNSPGNKVTCSVGNCPQVQAAKTTTVTEFQNSLKTDVTGFVAVDNTNSLVVVSFRGSTSIQNWIANFDIGAVNTDLCNGCTAHSGFWNSWLEARDGVLAAVKSAAQANPKYKIVATGHSLGGAIASLATAQLRNSGYSVALYTFGAPRVASPKLSDYITAQPGGNYRITHWNDPVPRLPPISFNFVHISPEYYINKASLQTVAVPDIKTYSGNVNYNGNTAWILTDIGAHLWYFNSIAGCSVTNIGSRDGVAGKVEVVSKF
ncbi:Alpha/Beta hydrolase protein [Clohesyomyces aquaticus]|uniref:Alpha/Beta hydrolase protein n=1 Tax=Clohesyomyces aquaticus TaxID=1231657 RepID=A0A1Y2A4I0_9PLEO|nr:Alpha/Beta hydrolase protein [Clohesyomyces aquaticus]